MAAASENAARDAAFAELAESTESVGDPSDPGSQASEDSLSAAAGMATYVAGQGGIPVPGNPQEISITVGAEASAAGPETACPGILGSIKAFLFGNGEPSDAARTAEAQRQRNRELRRSGLASLRAEMGLVDQESAQRSLEGIDTAATVAKEAGSIGLESVTVVATMKSMQDLRTGLDIHGNEISKTQAAIGLAASFLGPLKSAGRGGWNGAFAASRQS